MQEALLRKWGSDTRKRRQPIKPAFLVGKWSLILCRNAEILCKIIPRSYTTQGMQERGIDTPTAIPHWLRAAEEQGISYFPLAASFLKWRL